MAQNSSTPDPYEYEEEYDTVGLGLDLEEREPRAPSATDRLPAGHVWIHPHGYSVRVRVTDGSTELLEKLADLGLGMASEDWCRLAQGPELWRATLRGSVHLGGRKPGSKTNSTCPLAKLNRRHSLKLYHLGVEVRGDLAFLDLAGVRVGDVATVADLIGIVTDIAYFKTIERYVVLSPSDAHRLASALGATPAWGRGSETAKHFTVRKHPVRIAAGPRRKATALVKCYRVGPGATSAYRLEVAITGRSNQRSQLREGVVDALDAALLDLVGEHGLVPIAKPARWEPVLQTVVDDAPRDAQLRRIRPSGWRGRGVPSHISAIMAECNTPLELAEADHPDEAAAELGASRIRKCRGKPEEPTHETQPGESEEKRGENNEESTSTTEELNQSQTHPSLSTVTPSFSPSWKLLSGSRQEPRLYSRSSASPNLSASPPRTRPSVWASPDPYAGIMYELEHSGLHEVIFPLWQSPTAFLEALGSRFRVGIGILAAIDAQGHSDTWLGVELLERKHSLFEVENPEVVVLVVDPSYLCHFNRAFCDDNFEKGPIMASGAIRGLQDPTAGLWVGMAGALGPFLADLRHAVELRGERVVLITQDARPARGRGPWEKSHAYRDTRVRSIIGDAGRRHATQRYFVETTPRGAVASVVTWKDELEGRMGRYLYRALWATGARRPRNPTPRTVTEELVAESG